MQNIEDIDNEQKQSLQLLEAIYDQNIKQLKNFLERLEQYTLQIQQKLKKLKLQVDQFLSNIIEKKNQVKIISKDFTNLQQTQINEEEKIINHKLAQIKEQLQNQLKDIEIVTKLDQLYSSKDIILINVDNKVKDNSDVDKIAVIEKKFDYQLIQHSSYEQNEWCYTIAFNKNATIMIAGCDKLIKVYEFKDNKLREVQQLNKHSKEVNCLQFMNKLNQFVSASDDSTIIIWEFNQKQQWQSYQILKGHSSYIYSITMNQNEDLLISGSQDNTIKFWSKQNNIWSPNQLIDCSSKVYSISLNNQEDQLIASVHDNKILIIKLQDKQWMIQQKISLEQFGARLCYINQNQFVFQPCDRSHLLIFDKDPKDQTFKKGQELQYENKETDPDCLFPIRFISQIGLIMVKNGQYVYFIKRNQNSQFKVEQSIDFDTNNLFGGITDDGRFTATWDDESREIQIRKFDF